MATFLFDSTVFGPVYSRRLGMSLGINLLPNNRKVCNFNCIYCECGLTSSSQPNLNEIPTRYKIKSLLTDRLKEIVVKNEKIDTITLAGNGEPTLHHDFPAIIDDVLELRSAYLPKAPIAILSNATLIMDEKIFNALQKVDLNILKLDSVNKETQRIINCPKSNFSLSKTIEYLKKFNNNLIIQTLFFRGIYKSITIDNTVPSELEPWLKTIGQIKPNAVMIYTIARDTPHKNLHKISEAELSEIAQKVSKLGIETQISA